MRRHALRPAPLAKDELLTRLAAVVLALALSASACASEATSNPLASKSTSGFTDVTEPPAGFTPITEPADVTTTTTTSGSTATVTTTAPTTQSDAQALVDQLTVAPEGSGAGYDRDLFDHWIDVDHDGCHTRCEVLEAEKRYDLPGLPQGGWLSIYDGYSTDDASELDVDHVVALSEAWRSGADRWDANRRRAFANDLDEPDALIAVTASTNRSKSDRDPASWQPPNSGAWCQFGLGWVRVKIKWELTADDAEVRALRNILRGC